MKTETSTNHENGNDANRLLADGWFKLPELPDSKNGGSSIYSERIIFKTLKGHEFDGWVRFDFECFVVNDRQISFEYNEVESWKYDSAFR